MRGVLISVTVILAILVVLLVPSFNFADARSGSWRFDAHSRTIDIDVCVACDSPIPGPPGHQGSAGEPGPQGQQGSIGPQGPGGHKDRKAYKALEALEFKENRDHLVIHIRLS